MPSRGPQSTAITPEWCCEAGGCGLDFLDITSRIETMDLLHTLAADEGKTILLSTHDLDTAIRYSDCLWIADGTSGRVITGTCGSLTGTDVFERIFGSKVAGMVAKR